MAPASLLGSRAARLLATALVVAAIPVAAAGGPRCPAGMVAVGGGKLERPGRGAAGVRTFCLDRTEVTVDAYAACASVGACSAQELECGNAATWGKKGLGSHPINCVTWAEAETFCREHGKRLPSEEEWEWAARGGRRGSTYPWGEDPPARRACWDGDGNDKGKGLRKATCAVGSYPSGRSAEGIQDLAGNVREWTSTAHDRHRVLRGGSWGDSLPEFLATDFRGWNAPDERIELLGFRCAAAVGAVVHAPVRKPRKLETSRAQTDEAGVMIFNEPMQLGSRRGRKR
jgi:formylglycine-generating enzyme required for sulfatase activity